MERRDVLKVSGAMLGYTLAGGTLTAVLSGCKADLAKKPADLDLFDDKMYNIIVDVTERILPATDTPGAKDANVVSYIHDRLKFFNDEEGRAKYFEGLNQLNTAAKEFGKEEYLSLDDEQRTNVLKNLFSSSNKFMKDLKEDTIVGYFTSEVGAMTLRYDPIPGAYQGCIDYTPGDKLWSY